MRGRAFTIGVLAVGAALAAACDASIGEPEAGADATITRDAAPLPDSAPPADATVDAAPLACDQGDLQTTDPATGTCYMLFENAANWQTAEAACAALGGTLAVIDDAAEQAVVGALASQLDPLTPDAWLGGSDTEAEGTWRWASGAIFYQAAAPVLYTNFRGVEPNDNGPNCVPVGEDCLVIEGDRADLGYSWDDRCCASQQPYICQR